MPVSCHFLGWDRPLTEGVRDFLIPVLPTGPVDLERDLVVVPTRQAGRRLTDALALRCGQAGTALLSCRVVTPSVLLGAADSPRTVARPLDVQSCWIDVLSAINITTLSGLFPSPPAQVDAEWALRFAGTIEDLRRALLDGGLTISRLVATRPDDLAELDRWRDLALLEDDYLARLSAMGLEDPVLQQLAAAEHPQIDAIVQRIIVAGVPDPTEPSIRVLSALAERLDLQILIAAPESHADAFDSWGRPRREIWNQHSIAFANPDQQILLAATPADQAERAIELLQRAATAGNQPAAIGTPDHDLIPHIQSALLRHGGAGFDPSDKPLRDHPLFHLTEAFVNLASDRSYAALAQLLRQPELLRWIEHGQRGRSAALLRALDDLQNEHIPWDLSAVRHWLSGTAADAPLSQTVNGIAAHLPAHGAPLSAALRTFMQAVLEHRAVTAGCAEDDEFERAARGIDNVLHELAAVESRTPLPLRNAALLLMRRLGELSYNRERDPAAIDLDGWLELPWNPAPTLIVTGFNEGIVPAAPTDSAFLTDSLRTLLGMRNDADTLACDTFLLQTLIEARRSHGTLTLIVGKVTDSGDPLRPSRLLLRCPDDVLPERAAMLFADVSVPRSRPAPTVAFTLNPAPPEDLPADQHIPTALSVTAFRDYLACPFRFYLRRILRMEPQDDRKRAPDALDFGIMVHEALQRMGENEELRTCSDARLLTSFLTEQVERYVTRQFGAAPALPIRMAMHAAQQRLEAAAHVQATLAADGWEIIAAETAFSRELGGLTLKGKIDRIDRHRDSGALRLIDYKSKDTSEWPAATHLGTQREDTPEFAQVMVDGKPKRWIDLQLPLYAIFGVEASETPPEPAYFNLPRAISETALLPWPTFDADLASSALDCAEAVTALIRAGTFWPPAERVDYDDFESLFHDGLHGWKELVS
ncbi:MAG: PD-(D/E)XK nuclease family protein [Lentisphaerae bacterium]|nr:PD-(D/E)XK nuclease family protein [Lentisphaerota bacterium]